MAFSVDSTSHATAILNNAGSTQSWNHTCGAAANKLVVTVGVGYGTLGTRTVSGVTYNGVALTNIASQDDGGFCRGEIWRLNDPPTGSAYSIVVTYGGTGPDSAAGAISFNGAAAAEGTPAGATNHTANPSITVADSASGDIVVAVYASDIGPLGTSTESDTLIWEDEDVDGDCDYATQRKTATGANTVLGWTAIDITGFGEWVIAAVAIKAGSFGPTILSHPAAVAADVAASAGFSVIATSSGGALHYQWKLNGTNVGSDSPSYSRTVISSDQRDSVTCDVSDNNGTTTSNAAILTLNTQAVYLRDTSVQSGNDVWLADPTATSGPAAQTLFPPLYSNANSLALAHTLSVGAVDLSPPLYTNSNDLTFVHVLSQAGGTQTLTPSLYTNSNSLAFAHTLTLYLTPSLYSNSNSLAFTHTLSVGPVTLTPSLYSNSNSLAFTHTLSVGPVTLTPSLYSNSNSLAFTHTLSVGPVTLTPSLYSNSNDLTFTHVLSQAGGAQTLTPSLYTNTAQFFTPTLTLYLLPSLHTGTPQFFTQLVGFELLPSLYTNAAQFFTATVTPGAVTLTPALFANTNQFFSPFVDSGSYLLTSLQAQRLYQIYLLHGLEVGTPLTVSQTQRVVGGLAQAITEGGGSVTIHTSAAPVIPVGAVGDMVDRLAALHGLTDDLVVTATSRVAGALTQTLATVGDTTTVSTL